MLQSSICSLLISMALIFQLLFILLIRHEYCPNPEPASSTDVSPGNWLAIFLNAFLTCQVRRSRRSRRKYSVFLRNTDPAKNRPSDLLIGSYFIYILSLIHISEPTR